MGETGDGYYDGCAIARLFVAVGRIIAVGFGFCFGECCRVDQGRRSGKVNQKEE
jgi:hypothetical protein